MTARVLLATLSFIVFIHCALAQTESPAGSAAGLGTAPLAAVTVPEGTPVRVRLMQPLWAAKTHVGDPISVEVLEDVVVGDRVVIQKGATGFSHVTEAQAARRLGRRGALALSVDSVQSVTGEDIPVRVEHQAEGPSSTQLQVGRMLATGIIVSPIFAPFWLLKHGNDAEVPEGTSFAVFTSQGAQLDMRKSLAPSNNNPLLLYQLAFLRNDHEGMEKQVSTALNSHSEDVLLSAQSDTEAYYGHLAKARELTQRATDSALQAGLKERAAVWEAAGALHEAELGDMTRSRQLAKAALALSSSKDVETLAALAYARGKDRKHAQGLETKLHEKFRMDAALNNYWLPTIDAAVALEDRKPKDALTSLQPANLHEMDTPLPLNVGTLYPAYLRGEAMLSLRRADAAVAAAKTIVDHPGIVVNFPLGALAHLQLARAYQLQKDTTEACSEYREFLKLWQNADPDIPILEQAKRESSTCGT